MQVLTRQTTTTGQAVVTFSDTENGREVIGWGVESAGTLHIRGAVDAAFVRSLNADPEAMADVQAAKIARMIRFDAEA